MDKRTQGKVNRLQDSLAALRKAAGWSAEHLAEELDVTRQTIVNIESGSRPLTKIQYLAIIKVLSDEVEAKGNETLGKLITFLVVNETEESTREKLKETIDDTAKKVGRRNGAVAIGAAIAVTVSAFLSGQVFATGLATANLATKLVYDDDITRGRKTK